MIQNLNFSILKSQSLKFKQSGFKDIGISNKNLRQAVPVFQVLFIITIITSIKIIILVDQVFGKKFSLFRETLLTKYNLKRLENPLDKEKIKPKNLTTRRFKIKVLHIKVFL